MKKMKKKSTAANEEERSTLNKKTCNDTSIRNI